MNCKDQCRLRITRPLRVRHFSEVFFVTAPLGALPPGLPGATPLGADASQINKD